ncbi:MAG: rod shape-determining protein RodA [Candidatus Moranbacteria bacterium]|jgi:rod shape determining protein RodA|nr:rod shape-determining protein RodA [Candidatus Moranbacteria bacterium]
MGNRFLKIDWILIVASFLLLTLGLLSLYSISTAGQGTDSNIFSKQVLFFVIGLVAMIFFANADYHYLRSYSNVIYFLTLGVLLAVIFLGVSIRGTSGWIGVGPFHIQPVEISKISLIIFLASFFSAKKMELGEISRIIASLILALIMIFFVIKQPDFGSAMILSGIWLGMVLLSGISKKNLFILFLLGVFVAGAGWFFLAPYQKERLANLFDPQADPQGSGYNVLQSIVAVGSGGMTGKGIGHGSQSQLNFLPEKHTDFIFAVIVEELGVFGAFLVLFLFGVIFYRIKKIAEKSRDNFGYLVAVGIMIMIFLQILINIGMNIGIMPVTGIPLPFLSYGGSSLVSMFIALGILINIQSKESRQSDLRVMQSY